MALYMPEHEHNETLLNNYYQYSQVGTLDVLGATFADTIYYNPTNALERIRELYVEGNSGRKLTPKEYRMSEYFREGIEVGDDGIYEGAASILANRHDEREKRQLVLNRSKGGFGVGAAQIGTGLVASMMDPLNIASAFIPSVGAARFASNVSRYGKSQARLLRGLEEGAVGAAVVEPVVIGAAALEQDRDYGFTDSLMNIAFGTALGGGLHVGLGNVSDKLSRVSPDTRDNLMRTAVAQSVEGRAVDVETVADADPNFRDAPEPGELAYRGMPRAERDLDPRFDVKGRALPTALRPAGKKPKSLIAFLQEMGGVNTKDAQAGEVRQILDKGSLQLMRKNGRSLDDLAQLAQEEGYIRPKDGAYDERVTIQDLIDAINEDVYSNRRVFSAQDPRAEEFLDAEKLFDEAAELGIDPRGMDDATFDAALSEARSRRQQALDQEAVGNEFQQTRAGGLTEEEFYAARQRAQENQTEYPEADDFRESIERTEQEAAEFDEDELATLQRENEQLQDDINFLEENDLIPDDLSADIRAADRLIDKAENGYDAATRAGANCVGRAG